MSCGKNVFTLYLSFCMFVLFKEYDPDAIVDIWTALISVLKMLKRALKCFLKDHVSDEQEKGYWSLDLSEDLCFSVRSFVHSFVRLSGRFPDNRPLLFSKILPQIVFQWIDVHDNHEFLKKILVASPGGQKGSKCPKMDKNNTFCPITFDPSIRFFWNLVTTWN